MVPTMMANQNHKEIPGNPSTATSSQQKLNDRSNGQPLRVLSEADWAFWLENGYVIIK
ncbi:MAG: phytanoyl-CoA dioxygenase, partial [Runella slithyformis]